MSEESFSQRTLRVVTRKSALALAQTRMIAAQLVERFPGLSVQEVHVVTEGDKVLDRSLAQMGGKGLFVKELEQALLDGKADFAVHSFKDVPAVIAQGLEITAIPLRASPWDILICRPELGVLTVEQLPHGAKVGTSSLRRKLQLLAKRSDLVIEMLRGNVDTRLRRVQQGDFDAIVLAHAGLQRLGLAQGVQGVLLQDTLIPAAGQGALALQTRSDDQQTIAMVKTLDHQDTRDCVTAERAVLAAIGATCVVPLGAFAVLDDQDQLCLNAFLATEDGKRMTTFQNTRHRGEALMLGQMAAHTLLTNIQS